MKVIDITHELEKRSLIHKFSRLMNLCEEAEAKLLVDPLPHIEKAYDRLFNMVEAVNDALDTLRGHDVTNPVKAWHIPEFISIRDEAYSRNQRATDQLQKALKRCQE